MPRELGFCSSGVNYFLLYLIILQKISKNLWQLRNESTFPRYAKAKYQWCWAAQDRAMFYVVGEATGSRLCPASAPHPNIQLPRKQPAAQSIANTTSSSENLTYNGNNDSIFSLIKNKQIKR